MSEPSRENLTDQLAAVNQQRQEQVAQLSVLNEIGQAVSSTLALDDLLETIHQQVGRIFDTTNFYVATYEEVSDEWTTVFNLEHGQRQPPIRRKVSAGLTGYIIRNCQPLSLHTSQEIAAFHRERGMELVGELAKSWLGVPLIAADKLVGVMAIQSYEQENLYGEQDLALFSTIAAQVSIAIRNARLFEQIQRRNVQLQTAAEVSHAASSILDMNELLERSVNLIRDGFDFYYVGLFLVDWDGKFAILQAGTGKAGQAMLERAHKLEIGGQSMVGWCVANRQARIALDVGQEAVRFDNPLLPETRSEMALPLISRGEILGALTVQSTEEAAFSDEDIAVLQTMADQIAIAIANAQQFELAKRARAETDKRVRELDCLNDIGRRLTESLPVEELLPWVAARIPPAMQYPSHCVVAVEYQGQTYGVPEAVALPRQVVQTLHAGDGAVGRIYVAYTKEHDFLDKESALLGDIARRVSGYIENQRLLREAETGAGELAMLFDVSRELSGAFLQAEEIGEIVARQLVELGELECSLSLIEPDGDTLRVLGDFFVEEDGTIRRETEDETFRFSDYPATACVIKTGQPLVIQASDPDAEPAEVAYMREHEVETLLILPLAVKGQAVGVMELESWEARDYTPEQVSLIMTLVNQAAVALENTRLFEQTQARAEEMAILNEMSRELSSLREIDTVIESVHRHSSLLIDATNFYIALYDAELDELSFPYYAEGEQVRRAGRRRAGKGMPEHVIRTRVPLLIKENVAVWLAGQGVDQIGQSAESWLGVPMMVGGQVIGVLAVQSYTTPRLYTENHRELLISIASQAAIAIQNARLFEQTQTARAQAQARARREQILRQIIVRVSASTDPDTIMRATVRELGTALGRPAFVRLGSAEELRTPNSQLAIQNSEGGE